MQEDVILKMLIQQVFEKAKKESGSPVRNAVVKYVHQRLLELMAGKGSDYTAVSVKTLERYYQKHIENLEVDSYCEPDDRVRFQFVKFLGYSNYNEYLANYYHNINQNSRVSITNNHANRDIIQIEKLEGGLDIH